MKNKTRCYVSRIRTHQTLIKLGRNRIPYKTKEYRYYELELMNGMKKLTPLRDASKAILIRLSFNVKGGVKPAEYRLKDVQSKNTCGRIMYTEQDALENKKEHHYIEYSPVEISFGTKGDTVNIIKPIEDALEKFARIPNDRQFVKYDINTTFGNKENSIDIELVELRTVKLSDVYYFRE